MDLWHPTEEAFPMTNLRELDAIASVTATYDSNAALWKSLA
jgi:hypothetical protein